MIPLTCSFSLDSAREHLECGANVCLGCVALAHGTMQEIIEICSWRFEDGLSFSFIYCLAIFTLFRVIRYRCYSKIYHPFHFDGRDFLSLLLCYDARVLHIIVVQ